MIKTKQENYEDEIINVKANILISIFLVAFIFVLVKTIKQYTMKDFGPEIMVLVFILVCIFILSFSYIILANIINAKKNLEMKRLIIERGKKIKGTIIETAKEQKKNYKNTYMKKASFFSKFSENIRDHKISYYYTVKVEIEVDGKKQIIQSPSLNFYPKYLVSNDVDVYLYDGMYYIDNYKTNIERRTSDEREIKNLKIVSILLFVTIACIWIISFLLHFLGIINREKLVFLLVFSSIIMVVINIGYTLKNIRSK